MYKRILLKLSGEALGKDNNVFDIETMDNLAKQIKKIVKNKINVAIVCGGGNLVRGRSFEKLGFNRVESDHIGMLGTTMNSMVLAGALRKNNLKATVMSATKVDGVEDIDIKKANELLTNNEIVLFGGGVGEPYFSTDTASALRASEINADVILMAKNGVDGVYDSDPDINPKAKKFDSLTSDDILRLNLRVIDSSAAGMCRDNKIDAFVFDMNEKDNIYKAAISKAKGTIIKAK